MGLPGIKERVAAETENAERQQAAAAIKALSAQAPGAAGTIGSVTVAPPTAGETSAAAATNTAQISDTQISEDTKARMQSDIAAATSVGAQAASYSSNTNATGLLIDQGNNPS